jgi:hypothetical protein
MKRAKTKAYLVVLFLVFGAALAAARQGMEPKRLQSQSGGSRQDARAGFGRPEAITGTILAVKPEEGVVVLAVRGPSAPPSTQVVGTLHTERDGDVAVQEEKTSVGEAPGETDYAFKLSSSALIRTAAGQRLTLASLAGLENEQATVRFVPQRTGNYVLGIEVGR